MVYFMSEILYSRREKEPFLQKINLLKHTGGDLWKIPREN